jgi:Mg-chelatase subunit ChlD
MALREVLEDDSLSARLTPSMALVEQLLLDKANLSGKALANARRLIKSYVDQLAEVLKTQVLRAVRGRVDRSIPPKRVFRNLDLKRTLWKNLINYHPDDRRLYVDRLYYRRTASRELPQRLIVVVDQSGSMVDAMVQTAILASIFATLPRVDVHLIAFDTNVIDLTPWIHDPFAVLMRTNLGGGNDGPKAMVEALRKVAEPRQTMMVWISDFFEFQNDRPLFEQIKAVKESGVRFLPVGALKSSGYFSVNAWFRTRLKEIGLPVLAGDVRKLIAEIKDFLR